MSWPVGCKTGVVLGLGSGVSVPGVGRRRHRSSSATRRSPARGGVRSTATFRSRRGPGGVERDITIHRPGGTFQQRRSSRGRTVTGGWGPGPRFGGPPVFVGGGGGGGSGPGARASSAGRWGRRGVPRRARRCRRRRRPGRRAAARDRRAAGRRHAAAPPPVVEYVPPVRYQPAPQPTVVVDPVAQEIARFQSNHEASRRRRRRPPRPDGRRPRRDAAGRPAQERPLARRPGRRRRRPSARSATRGGRSTWSGRSIYDQQARRPRRLDGRPGEGSDSRRPGPSRGDDLDGRVHLGPRADDPGPLALADERIRAAAADPGERAEWGPRGPSLSFVVHRQPGNRRLL